MPVTALALVTGYASASQIAHGAVGSDLALNAAGGQLIMAIGFVDNAQREPAER